MDKTQEEILIEFKEKHDAALEKAETLLSSAIHTLLKRHGFIGHLIQMLHREFTLQLPTAAVGAKQSRHVLLVNPFFYANLKVEEANAVLKHEIFHLLNDHLKRIKGRDPRIWNVACDMAINPFIQNLPRFNHAEAIKKLTDMGVSKEEAGKSLPKPDRKGTCCDALLPQEYGLPVNRPSEWYYDKITQDKKLKEQFQKKVVNISNLSKEQQKQLTKDLKEGKARVTVGEGDHGEWANSSEQTDQILDEELKRMIKEAMEKAPKSFGNLPGKIQAAILEFLSTHINWKARLRSWLQRATQVLRAQTRKRPSRRFGITFPGQKTDFKLNLGVIVDCSASIYDSDLSLFGGEINRIWDTKIADVTIITGDTEIHDVYSMSKRMKPDDFKVTGRGGTDANVWIRYVEKQMNLDAVVILTDGEFHHKMKKPKFPVMWALTERGYTLKEFEKSIPFGKSIKLETEAR